MKFYSELTKEFYSSPEECVAAEEELKAHEEAEKRKAEEFEQKKEARRKDLEAAAQEARDAQKRYQTLLQEYLCDYKTVRLIVDNHPIYAGLDKNWFHLFG